MSNSAKLDELEPTAIEKMAVLDYQPLQKEVQLPSNEEWARSVDTHLMIARLALAMCKKTKSELGESVKKAHSISEFDLMMRRIKGSKDFFQEFADILKQAELRCMVAAAAKLRETKSTSKKHLGSNGSGSIQT